MLRLQQGQIVPHLHNDLSVLRQNNVLQCVFHQQRKIHFIHGHIWQSRLPAKKKKKKDLRGGHLKLQIFWIHLKWSFNDAVIYPNLMVLNNTMLKISKKTCKLFTWGRCFPPTMMPLHVLSRICQRGHRSREVCGWGSHRSDVYWAMIYGSMED